MRVRSIDAFRGMAIVLMVFFTVINKLGGLPDILRHNVPGGFHVGDLVLPFFLFASGMSLFFFAEKREKEPKREYMLDIIERFGKLVLISFLLSPFIAGGIFRMDEVMLNALLFVPSVMLLALPELAVAVVALLVFVVYFALMKFAMLPDFNPEVYYLGGYAAAPFYLPVMLGGVMAGRRIAEKRKLFPLLIASVAVSMLLFVVPPDKLAATPSFMALSIAGSLALFMLVDFLEKKFLFFGFFEYLGTKPIRYWVLMFVFFVVPVSFYAVAADVEFPLGIGWEKAVLIGMAYVPALYLASRLMDYAGGMLGRMRQPAS